MGKSKIAELYGGGFSNRGAELMVDACCQEVDSWGGPWELAMDWSIGTYDQRARRGIRHKMEIRRLKSMSSIPAKLMPEGMKHKLGLVSECDVNAVFDIAGFAYSDQWGTQYAEQMASRVARRSSKGERYFLLPQAFGPFEDSKVAEVAKSYFDGAELLCVRDGVSMDHMKKLLGQDERLKLSPDFTCLVKPMKGVRPVEGDYACIVPNCRMVDKRHGDLGESYVKSLVEVIDLLDSRGIKPILVNHEGAQDLALVKELEKRSRCSVTVIEDGDARYLKGVFTHAQLVIASRFHALVSSLTQSVPVIGTGWSHKYEGLFADFGVSEYLVSEGADSSEYLSRVESLLNDNERTAAVTRIEQGMKKYKLSTSEMWSDLKRTL